MRHISVDRPGSSDLSRPALWAPEDLDVVRVRNETYEDQTQYAVLGLGEVINKPDDTDAAKMAEFKLRPAEMKGEKPEKKHRGKWCVLLHDLAGGETGLAAASGMVQAKIRVLDATKRVFADLDDEGRLIAADHGCARVLWVDDPGTTPPYEAWAVLRLSNRPEPPWVELVFDSLVKHADWDKTPGAKHKGRVKWKYDRGSMTAADLPGWLDLGASTYADCYMKFKRAGVVHVEVELAVTFGNPISGDAASVTPDLTAATDSVDVGDHGSHYHSVTYRFFDPNKDWQWAAIECDSNAVFPVIVGVEDLVAAVVGRGLPTNTTGGTDDENWYPPVPHNSCFAPLYLTAQDQRLYSKFRESLLMDRDGNRVWSNVTIHTTRTRMRIDWETDLGTSATSYS